MMNNTNITPNARHSRLVATFAFGAAILWLSPPLHAAEAMKNSESMKTASPAPTPPPAVPGFDQLKALVGDWIDFDAKPDAKDLHAVTYRVTGAGTAVVETLLPGKPHEMVSVYHRDGNDLVMTHYCAAGNQPRMRAKSMTGNVLTLDFDGGTNVDPAKDVHIHSARFEFVSADEIRVDWNSWSGGKPAEPSMKLHLKRKKA